VLEKGYVKYMKILEHTHNIMNYSHLIVLLGLVVFLNSKKLYFLLVKPHYNLWKTFWSY